MNINFKCSTDGTGFWSVVQRPVRCIIMEMFDSIQAGDNASGELRVYFKNWNIDHDGLIYTDPQFIKELRGALNDLGFSPESVEDFHYSEQGMQGRDYVSFDAWDSFIPEFRRVKLKLQADEILAKLRVRKAAK